MEPAAERLRAAGVRTVELVRFDASQPDTHEAIIEQVWADHPDLDLVLLAFGVLGDQDAFDHDPAGAAAAATTNYVGGVSAGLAAAEHLRRQGHGTLAVITSVAGVRVRSDNVVYGSTKAGLDAFAQGWATAGGHGRRGGGDPARVRAHRHDRGHGGWADGHHRRRGGSRCGGRAAPRRPHHLVAGQARWVFAVLSVLPRPLWRAVAARR